MKYNIGMCEVSWTYFDLFDLFDLYFAYTSLVLLPVVK